MPGYMRVTVSGRLRAADMGRLERACGEALTHNPLQLDLDLTRVTETDQTSAAIVERLRQRGARVRSPVATIAGTATLVNGARADTASTTVSDLSTDRFDG